MCSRLPLTTVLIVIAIQIAVQAQEPALARVKFRLRSRPRRSHHQSGQFLKKSFRSNTTIAPNNSSWERSIRIPNQSIF